MLLKEGEYVHLVIGGWFVNNAYACYIKSLRDFDLAEERSRYMEHCNTLNLVCSDGDNNEEESRESQRFLDYLVNNDLVKVIDMHFANVDF